jgi:hypothetical protein
MGKLKSLSIPDAVLFVLSLIYLGAEVYFNMSLLDIAGSVKSRPDDIHDIQTFGRSVSAFGCVLLVWGLFVRSGFRVRTRRDVFLFSVIAALSLIPLIAVVLHAPFRRDTDDVFLSILPLLAIILVAVSRAKFRFYVIMSLMLMAWPAVFLGQKLLIEQALVDRTGVQERVNARYVLMLRAGFENCSMTLDDLQLCDARGQEDLVKSARIIMSALWTLYPEGIRQDMIDNKEKLVESIAARDDWFSNPVDYDKYVSRVAEERGKFEREMLAKYYEPYHKASGLYADATNPEKLKAESGKIADQIDESLEDGWRQYLIGVREFNQTTSGMMVDAARDAAAAQSRFEKFCSGRLCEKLSDRVKHLDPEQVARAATDKASRKFIEMSGGYPPDIESRDTFIAYGVTQNKIRQMVEKKIQERPGFADFMLPMQWQYDREQFMWMYENIFMQEADRRWKEKFKKVPPGLDQDELFDVLGIAPLPALEKLLMTPDAFFNKYVLPRYKEVATRAIDGIEGEKHLYATGEELEEKGKDYVRAVYIPAIALVISLLVVVLTVLRWSVAGITLLLKKLRVRQWGGRVLYETCRVAAVAAAVAGLATAPYAYPHPYAEGGAYQRYMTGARQKYPEMASVLDWAIHAQPIIYRIGSMARLGAAAEAGKSGKEN